MDLNCSMKSAAGFEEWGGVAVGERELRLAVNGRHNVALDAVGEPDDGVGFHEASPHAPLDRTRFFLTACGFLSLIRPVLPYRDSRLRFERMPLFLRSVSILPTVGG